MSSYSPAAPQTSRKINPDDARKLDIMLPDNPNIEELMTELESIVSGKGLLISSLSFSWDKGGEEESKAVTAAKKSSLLSINV